MNTNDSLRRTSGNEDPITHDITAPITTQAQDSSGGAANASTSSPGAQMPDAGPLEGLYQRARDGNAQAQFELALACQQGLGVQENLEEAKRWYGLALQQGHLAAHYNLGHLWWENPGQYTVDAHADALWFRAEAEAGDAVAQWVMGLCAEYGQGGAVQDAAEAVRWYRMSVEQEFGPALCSLADKYERGVGVPNDKGEALYLYCTLADKEAAIAYYGLGQIYQEAQGAGQAVVQAFASYKKAKHDNRTPNIPALITMPGGEFERGQALLAQCNAAKHNSAAAMPNAELICHQAGEVYGPKEIPETRPLAFALYLYAAEMGHSEAQFQAAFRYQHGLGVAQSNDLAIEWYRKSAEQGYHYAQIALAELYESGDGLPQDAAKARKWYQKAAAQGNWQAEVKVGLRNSLSPSMYEMGIALSDAQSSSRDPRHGRLIAESRKSPGLPIASTLLLAIPLFLMFAGGAIALGLFLLAFLTVVWVENYQHRVKLYEHALERSGLFGTKTVAIGPGTQCYYRSVSESYLPGVQTGRYLYIVVDDGKVRLKLSPLLDAAEELQANLTAAETQNFLPLARQAYREGKSLDFQVLRLQSGKLYLKNKELALADITSMEISNGQLIIYGGTSRCPFLKMPLERIPNMQTLFRLLIAYSTVDSPSG